MYSGEVWVCGRGLVEIVEKKLGFHLVARLRPREFSVLTSLGHFSPKEIKEKCARSLQVFLLLRLPFPLTLRRKNKNSALLNVVGNLWGWRKGLFFS